MEKLTPSQVNAMTEAEARRYLSAALAECLAEHHRICVLGRLSDRPAAEVTEVTDRSAVKEWQSRMQALPQCMLEAREQRAPPQVAMADESIDKISDDEDEAAMHDIQKQIDLLEETKKRLIRKQRSKHG